MEKKRSALKTGWLKKAAGNFKGFPRFPLLVHIILLFLMAGALESFGGNVDSLLSKTSYSETQKKMISDLFSEALSEDVPVELLLPRLEEGIAKRVSGNLLLKVLQADFCRLKEARAIILETIEGMDINRETGVWARTANLLAKDISAEELKALVYSSRLRWQDYREATSLYVSLLKWGLDRESALAVTEALLAASIPRESFKGLIDIFVKGRRLRISPEELCGRIIGQIGRVDSLENLERRILY